MRSVRCPDKTGFSVQIKWIAHKDYCRQLTAHDDGHCLETDNTDKEPF
jgi:hypothetical protein